MELISSYGKSLHGGAQLSFRPAGCLYNNFFFLWREQIINRLCPKFSGGLGDVVSGREQLRCSTLPLPTSPRPPENFGQRLLIIRHLEKCAVEDETRDEKFQDKFWCVSWRNLENCDFAKVGTCWAIVCMDCIEGREVSSETCSVEYLFDKTCSGKL